MNREKSVSVRFAAVGGQAVKAEMRDIGTAGRDAMQGITSSTGPASAGLDNVSAAASEAQRNLMAIAARAAASAQAMRATGQAVTPMVDQINRLTGVTPAIGQSTAEFIRQGQVLDDLRAKYNPVFGVIRQYRAEVSEIRAAHLEGAISANEMASAISRVRSSALDSIAVYKNQSRAIHEVSAATSQAGYRMRGLFYQVNDIGVSLAGGMNPFVVMAQQGTQIAQIYGFGNGGVGGLLRDLGRMIGGVLGRFPLITAAVAAAGAVVAELRSEINDAQKVTVSFGDTALAIFQVIGRGIYQWIEPAVSKIADWFSAAWDAVVAGVTWAGNSLINGMRVAGLGIKTAVDVIPRYFAYAWEMAKANVFWALNDMSMGVFNFLDSVSQGLNSVFGTNLSGPQALSDMATTMNKSGSDAAVAAKNSAEAAATAWERFGARRDAILQENPMGDLYNSVRDQAVRNALTGDDEGAGGGQKDQVDDLVKSLQSELAVLRETDPVKRKMLEYSEKLAGATAEEKRQVFDLVTTLDRAKTGWEAVSRTLAEYAEESKRIGDDIGQSFADGFKSAEDAFRTFVTGGKADFKSLIQSMVADLAVLQFRQSILGPIAESLSGGFLQRAVASLYHSGGTVGSGGATRSVPAELFVGAQRFHSGGMVLAPDERPAILQTGERVLSRNEVAQGLGSQQSVSVVEVRLGDGLKAEIVSEANAGAVQIVQGGLRQFKQEVLPVEVPSIMKNPRRRGI